MDGSMGEFHLTFAQLSVNAQVPVVPVVIDGAFDVLPRGKSLPACGKTVKLTFLPPITPDANKTAEAILHETRENIQAGLEKK